MKIELNPAKWFSRKAGAATVAPVAAPAAQPQQESTTAKAEEIVLSIKTVFLSIMSWIGKEEKVVYADIIKYAPSIAALAELLFPAESAAIAAGTSTVLDATQLIQNAVLMVEQKYAASGVSTGTGAQKSAEVLSLAGSAVSSLLTQAGQTVTADYLQSLITAVVGFLNVYNVSVPAPATA